MLLCAAFVPASRLWKRAPGAENQRLVRENTVSANKNPAKKTAPKTVLARGKTVGSASAASILGRPLAKHAKTTANNSWMPVNKIKPEWQKFYQNLLDLHARLRDQMSGLAKESQSQMESYSLHMGDSGTDNFDRDFALSLLSSDQDAVYEIEEALKRIEKGTYGICELTQKSIPKARLEAIPWARFAVDRVDVSGELRRGHESCVRVDARHVEEVIFERFEREGRGSDRPGTVRRAQVRCRPEHGLAGGGLRDDEEDDCG